MIIDDVASVPCLYPGTAKRPITRIQDQFNSHFDFRTANQAILISQNGYVTVWFEQPFWFGGMEWTGKPESLLSAPYPRGPDLPGTRGLWEAGEPSSCDCLFLFVRRSRPTRDSWLCSSPTSCFRPRTRCRVTCACWPWLMCKLSTSKFPCNLSRSITSHSMENLAFHSFTKMKDDYTSNSHNLTYTFPLKGCENVPFELGSERVKGLLL